jgi:hypothetical protein
VCPRFPHQVSLDCNGKLSPTKNPAPFYPPQQSCQVGCQSCAEPFLKKRVAIFVPKDKYSDFFPETTGNQGYYEKFSEK